MKLAHIVAALEEFAPRALQESWDNSGLQIALPPEAEGECTGVLLCVDVTEAVIAEAVERGCNLVLSHHPLIFKGLKTLAGRTPSERAAAAAVRAGVAVYCAHTSLDSTRGGVSYAMAEMLGARVLGVLEPSQMKMLKISVICPRKNADDIRLLMLQDEELQPVAWDVEADELAMESNTLVPVFEITHTPLTRVEVVVPAMRAPQLRSRLKATGVQMSIEELALDDRSEVYGLGVVAEFEQPVTLGDLAAKLHSVFGPGAIRANRAAEAADAPSVRRIALCGGAGGEFIPAAEAAGAQAYVTADVRYHDFADHRSGMAIFDIGHFESENCAKSIFSAVLCKKFPNFAVQNSQTDLNPVIYL